MTSREELLAAGVNARIAQRRQEERRWWLRLFSNREAWTRGGIFGGVAYAMGMGIFWLNPPKDEVSYLINFGVAVLISSAGGFIESRFARQQKTIGRLEERVRILEEGRTP